MGEKQTKPFQLNFNGLLKVDFQGSHVTSDGGLILVRELDERLGLGELIEEHLSDSRQGVNKKFPLADLLRQSVYSRLAGYEDLNDAVRVSADPTFRLIGSKRNWDRGAALTSTLHGFETEMAGERRELAGADGCEPRVGCTSRNCHRFGPRRSRHGFDRSPVHGQQEGSAYNGHFESVCYHPLLLFNQHGDCLAAKAAAGQRTQRQGLERVAAARDRAPTGCGQAGHLPGAMRPLPSRRFMSLRKNAECSTPFAFRPTRAWNWRLKTSCFGRRAGRVASPGALQELPLSGGELVQATTHRGQGRASSR